MYVFFFTTILTACNFKEPKELSATSIDAGFSAEVSAIISAKCVSCHTGVNASGGFNWVNDSVSLINSGFVIKGDAANSILYKKVLASPPYGSRMPTGGPYLSELEISQLASWINSLGAKPKATVTLASTAAAIPNVSPIAMTVTFSEAVTGFTSGDVVITNGTISNFQDQGLIIHLM